MFVMLIFMVMTESAEKIIISVVVDRFKRYVNDFSVIFVFK